VFRKVQMDVCSARSWLMNVHGAGQYGCMLCQVMVDECAWCWFMLDHHYTATISCVMNRKVQMDVCGAGSQ